VEFIEPPPLAIKCRAEDNRFLSDIAEVFCEKLAEIEFLTIRCVKVVDGVLSFQIIHPNDVDFVEWLCMDLMPGMSGNIVKTRGFMIKEIPTVDIDIPSKKLSADPKKNITG
jgi:hypothetical protein